MILIYKLFIKFVAPLLRGMNYQKNCSSILIIYVN